jgi:hypothetical protein
MKVSINTRQPPSHQLRGYPTSTGVGVNNKSAEFTNQISKSTNIKHDRSGTNNPLLGGVLGNQHQAIVTIDLLLEETSVKELRECVVISVGFLKQAADIGNVTFICFAN